MSTTKFLSLLFTITILVCPAAAGDIDMPKIKVIKIKEPVTRAVIDILPGRGVKLIFPWILDERSTPTPARIVITNDAVFNSLRGEQQNAIEFKIDSKIRGPQIEGEICDAFISVEGFHFVFTLRVNFSKRAHYSTILLELEQARKYELVKDAINQHRKELESQLSKAGKDLDELAKRQSLKLIARTVLSKPQKTRVYEKKSKKIANGDRIIFQADQMVTYGDIHILKIGVENDSKANPLYINGIQIIKSSGDNQSLFCQHEIAPRVDAGEKANGFVVTRDARITDNKDTKMTLFTNHGEVALEW